MLPAVVHEAQIPMQTNQWNGVARVLDFGCIGRIFRSFRVRRNQTESKFVFLHAFGYRMALFCRLPGAVLPGSPGLS